MTHTTHNPYKASKHATLAELRALAFQAFADHKQDMKSDGEYRRAHLSLLAANRKAKAAR